MQKFKKYKIKDTFKFNQFINFYKIYYLKS